MCIGSLEREAPVLIRSTPSCDQPTFLENLGDEANSDGLALEFGGFQGDLAYLIWPAMKAHSVDGIVIFASEPSPLGTNRGYGKGRSQNSMPKYLGSS